MADRELKAQAIEAAEAGNAALKNSLEAFGPFAGNIGVSCAGQCGEGQNESET